MDYDILNTIKEKGLLLDKDVFELLKGFQKVEDAKNFLEKIEKMSGQKIITKSVLSRNLSFVKSIVMEFEREEKEAVEKIFIKLGINFEITKEKEVQNTPKKSEVESGQSYKIFYADTRPDKKLEVKDFTGNFRARYHEIQRMLLDHGELRQNLVSINKISSERSALSIIGIVTEKRVTKNKNLVIKFEDLTGEINTLIKFDKKEVFEKANELQLDDVVGVRGSGNSDMLFVSDIIFPDSYLIEKTRFNEEKCVAFLSDLHCGSDRHLEQSFDRFLKWLNSDDEAARKISYIFFTGDNVDGVGIFPGQENVLKLRSMKDQYKLLASYMRRIPRHITIFMCPGQHDSVRVAEPQPIIGKDYAPELYEIENLVLVTNPTLVKLMEGEKEFKVLMYHGASIHSLINEIPELREMKAHKCPARAVRHMLKRRHLAMTHSNVVYIPNADRDPLVISEVPDVLCTGEVHRLDIETYNGVLIITGSCWQAQTPFEEKVGNIPDPAKVPVLNLKNRELKIYDFGVEEEINREY